MEAMVTGEPVMGRKSQQQALLAAPPVDLTLTQSIGKVEAIHGNNIYSVNLPASQALKGVCQLVELPPRFRNTMWIRRGGFVLVDCSAFEDRDNKLVGEIMAVIHDEKSWRKKPYWPVEFRKEEVPLPSYESDEEISGNLNRRRYDSSDGD